MAIFLELEIGYSIQNPEVRLYDVYQFMIELLAMMWLLGYFEMVVNPKSLGASCGIEVLLQDAWLKVARSLTSSKLLIISACGL